MKLNFSDNFSFHKAKNNQEILCRQWNKKLLWPAKSQDINIIDDIWKMISELT